MQPLKFKDWINKTLNDLKISKLKDVQISVFKKINLKKNLVIASPTGTGKTLAYLLPALEKIDFNLYKTQLLIISPTKELARQIYSVLNHFRRNHPKIRSTLLIGNQDLKINSKNEPQIIVGTITKVYDLYINKKYRYQDLKFLVLDEVDMLIDSGFLPQVSTICNKLKANHNLVKLAVSASLHSSLADFIKNYFGNAIKVVYSDSIWENNQIKHHIVYSHQQDKFATFKAFIKNINPFFCIIFANTKDEVEKIYQYLISQNLSAGMLHKNLSIRERKNVFKTIKNNPYQYLVATDIAARGIDIDGVDKVISYSLPSEHIWYIHRSGRTGRNKYQGDSYVIYNSGIDYNLNYLAKKGINWDYIFINKDNEFVSKKLNLKKTTKNYKMYDQDPAIKSQINRIINQNSKKIKPGYKKKIKLEIKKIHQKHKRAHIENKYQKILLAKNIINSKRQKRHH